MGECDSCIRKAVPHSPQCPQTSSALQGLEFTQRLDVNDLLAGRMWGRRGIISPYWHLSEPVPPAQAVESRAEGPCSCVLCPSVHLRAQRGHLLGYSWYPTSAQLLQGNSQWTWALSTLQPRDTLQPLQQLPRGNSMATASSPAFLSSHSLQKHCAFLPTPSQHLRQLTKHSIASYLSSVSSLRCSEAST